MPGRTYNGGDYRYGFNGAEKDDDEVEVQEWHEQPRPAWLRSNERGG